MVKTTLSQGLVVVLLKSLVTTMTVVKSVSDQLRDSESSLSSDERELRSPTPSAIQTFVEGQGSMGRPRL